MERPVCGKCGGIMTPENSRQRPELFLHDRCLPDELRPPEQRYSCAKCKITGMNRAESFIHEKLHSGDDRWAEFGNPTLLNHLPFVLFSVVGRLMEAYHNANK